MKLTSIESDRIYLLVLTLSFALHVYAIFWGLKSLKESPPLSNTVDASIQAQGSNFHWVRARKAPKDTHHSSKSNYEADLNESLDQGLSAFIVPTSSIPPGVLSKLRINDIEKLAGLFQLSGEDTERLKQFSSDLGESFGELQREFLSGKLESTGVEWTLRIPKTRLDTFVADARSKIQGMDLRLRQMIETSYFDAIVNLYSDGIKYRIQESPKEEGRYFLYGYSSDELYLGVRPIRSQGAAKIFFKETSEGVQFDLRRYLTEF